MTSMVASYPSNADEHAGRSSVKAGLTPKGPRRQVENDESTGHSSGASCAATVAGLQTATWEHSSS
jgi:hypothetical protein